MRNPDYYPYYFGYWHKEYSQLVDEAPNISEVVDPKTGKKIIIKNALDEFIDSIKTKDQNKILKSYQNITNFFKLSDNIDRQLKKLIETYQKTGLSSAFEKQVEKVYNYYFKDEKKYVPISDRYVEMYLNNKVEEKGISFLCNELDKRTNGIMPGTICTLCGGPGSMKTTLAMNIAYQALKDGKNVCYITLEETPLTLYSKLLSRVSVDAIPTTPFTVNDIINSKLNSEEKNILFNIVKPYLDNLEGKLHIIGDSDITSYNTKAFEKAIERVNNDLKDKTGKGVDLVILDHIQLLKYSESEKDEKEIINSFVSFFRKMSLSFLDEKREISVILLSQVNREGLAYSRRNDGAYLMQHVAEASEIERSSTYIISVYTDPLNQLSKCLKIGTLKLRNAPLLLETVSVLGNGKHYLAGQVPTPEQAEYTTADIGLGPENNTNNPSSTPNLEELLSINVDLGL